MQGDGTFENPGGVHEVDNGARVFGPGHAFKIDGITWEILGVPTAFTFNPALVGVNPSDPVMPDILTIGGEEKKFDGTYTLVRVAKDGQFYELKNDDKSKETLRELAYAVMMASTVEQLNELAEGMEKGTMFVVGLALDIAELFPVAGQAAAAARVVLTVGGLLADHNVQELFHALIDDPAGVIDKVKDYLLNILSVEGLVEHLLLDPNLEFLEKLGSLIPPPRETGSTTSGIGRVLRRLQALGHAVAGAIGRVVGFAHDVRDDIQGFIVEHPVLARVLAFIADNLDLIIEAVEHAATGDLDDFMLGKVSALFMEIVNAIGRIRFPMHLVTWDDVVDFFLNLVGNRLGGKYAIGYKVIKALLEAVHRWGEVEHAIGSSIQRLLGKADPLKLLDGLSNFANTWLAEHLKPVQQFTYNILNTIFTALPKGQQGLPPFNPVSVEDSGDQFLDAAPLMRPGTVVAPMPERVELSSGSPLERGARKKFERELGSDLSHVRLHTGADAERATRAIGARALTTGSHVLVAPDVLLGTSGGDRVMRHELAHVLQQTGPRAPGSGDVPEVGKPGLGVRIDPEAERIAEEIAVGGMPSTVRAQAVGYQPDLIGLGMRFMSYVNHAERAKKEITNIEATGAGTGRELIGEQVREDVANVGSALSSWIDGFSTASMSKDAAVTFGSVADKIKAWLVERKSDITNAIDDLAIDSEHAVKLKDDTNETPEMKLEVRNFQLKLVRFMLVATGCDIKIELNVHEGKLVADNPLKQATFELLYMPIIPATGAGGDLWDTLMTNTFGAVGDAKKRAMTRIVLFALGTGENPYDSGFKLDDQRKNHINFDTPALDTGKSGATVDRLPPAAQFWYGLGTPPSDQSLPALWVGKHRDATHHGKGGRQSHHTTQYLLVQYFEQAHTSVAPFPVLRGEVANVFSKHMGFALDKQYVDKVADIEVGTLDVGDHRGGGMPALLVAAVTHRRTPRMHVAPLTSEEKGEDDDIPSSQGGRVHRWFQEALGAVYGDAKNYWIALAAVDQQKTPSLVGAIGANPQSEPLDWFLENAPDLALKLPQAMRRVYARMRDQMIPAIRPGLETLEQTWYEQLALAKGEKIDSGPYAVGPLMPAAVAKAAESNNTLIMETNSKWA